MIALPKYQISTIYYHQSIPSDADCTEASIQFQVNAYEQLTNIS